MSPGKDILDMRKPLFRRALHISDSPYYLKRTEEEGERDLYNIVKNAKQEHCWVYFPETTTWVGYTVCHSVNTVEDGLRAGFKLFGETPFGKEQIYYHIHPDPMWSNSTKDKLWQELKDENKPLQEDILAIIRATPSGTDCIVAAEKMNGKEMRVLSGLGVFSLKGYFEFTPPDYSDYTYLLGEALNLETLRVSGVYAALQEMVEEMNSHMNNYLSISFRPRKF